MPAGRRSLHQIEPSESKQRLRALLHGDLLQVAPLLAKVSQVLRARRQLGARASLGAFVRVIGRVQVANGGGKIAIGAHTLFHARYAPCTVVIHGHGSVEIGDYCFLNYGATITAAQSVQIGHRSLVGPYCFIIDTNLHDLRDRRKPAVPEPVRLGEDVWLGAHVTVLPGVTIGDGAVIGAGSVVTRDIPPRCLAAGNPAHVIRTLDDPGTNWLGGRGDQTLTGQPS